MIIAAAIKVIKDNEECIFMGKRHGNCIEQFAFCNFRMPLFESVQGFVTDDFRFLDRVEAKKYAIECGQLIAGSEEFPTSTELYSEDLW